MYCCRLLKVLEMAKHIANVRLSGDGGQSAAVPLSVVQLPVSAIGNNNNQSAIFHSESGQTIQMIKVGNRFYQVLLGICTQRFEKWTMHLHTYMYVCACYYLVLWII